MLLDFIEKFINDYGYSPTLREIMTAQGYKSVSTVAKHIDNLVVLGRLEKREGEARSLVIVHDHRDGIHHTSQKEHLRWLKTVINKKLAIITLPVEDRVALERAMELLVLDIDNG